MTGRAAMAALVIFVGAGCGDDGGDTGDDPGATTSTTVEETTTTVGESTTTEVPATEAGLAPGDPCDLDAGVADCIDPDGDGEGTYLLEGDDCMAALADAPELCTDLDGDGVAGYPDSG